MEMATAIDFLNTEVVPLTSMTNQLVETGDSGETPRCVNMNLWFILTQYILQLLPWWSPGKYRRSLQVATKDIHNNNNNKITNASAVEFNR